MNKIKPLPNVSDAMEKPYKKYHTADVVYHNHTLYIRGHYTVIVKGRIIIDTLKSIQIH